MPLKDILPEYKKRTFMELIKAYERAVDEYESCDPGEEFSKFEQTRQAAVALAEEALRMKDELLKD